MAMHCMEFVELLAPLISMASILQITLWSNYKVKLQITLQNFLLASTVSEIGVAISM